ncbi:hypothetical protein ACQ4PT_064102 [Festuca glaucescens]
MADDGASGAGGSESTTIEINIKTLESQVHKLRVQKSFKVLAMPSEEWILLCAVFLDELIATFFSQETVLNLKEKIVDVAGIPVDQQRLIFRGRVLKDDHLLSEYRILLFIWKMDIHCIWLLDVQLKANLLLELLKKISRLMYAGTGPDELFYIFVVGAVNVVENGAMLGDYMSRTVQDILGSLGLGMPGGVANATFSVPLNTAPNGATTNGRTQPGNPPPPGFSILNHQIHVSQLQPGGANPHNMVIPDSMMTLLEYINRMDQVLQNNGVPSADSNTQQPPRPDDAYLNQRFPSPEVLVSVLERAQQVLGGSASSALSHLAQHIQRDAAAADTSIRSQIQNESAQLGVAMQHLGAMLLELGRTMMMLRMGASSANAFVNAGSAVYINPTGPNPIMVQPSYQSAPHFGVSSIPVLSGVSGPFGIVDPSRTSGGTLHSNTSDPSLTLQDSSTVNVSTVDVNNIRIQSRELAAASLAGQLTDTYIGDVPLSTSAESSESNNKPSDGVTGESTKPSASGSSGPFGLGGGLQPKRCTRVAKPSGTSGDSGEAPDTSSVTRSQEAVLMGQQALQALVSKSANASSGSATNSHSASSMPQVAAGMPPRRPGGEGQVDIGSMLSSVLNSPVFGNLMSNVAAQTGLESPSDVRNIMEDLTQNSAVMDTLSSMIQSVDGPRRGQGGGIDLSRMMQQMMPVVNQVLGGVAARPAGTETVESRLQPRQNDREVSDAVDGRSSEIDLHEACERIEQCDPPEDIFGAVLETAAQAYGEDESIQFMLEELASDPELADDYLKLLLEQVGERVESDSENKKQS